MPSANNGQALIQHLQLEKKEEQKLQWNRDWEEADDAQVQEAIMKAEGYELGRTLLSTKDWCRPRPPVMSVRKFLNTPA
jgi:hypothetical protein